MSGRKKPYILKLNRGMQKKLVLLFVAVTLAFVGLILRLSYIQRTSGERYTKIVLSQQEYDSKTLPYRRGDIIDARGTVLATSTDVYNVILDCKVLNADYRDGDPKKDRRTPTLNAFGQCFPDVDMKEVYRLLNDPETAAKQYTVLLKKQPYEMISDYVLMKEEAAEKSQEKNSNVLKFSDGIWFEKEYERQYPYKEMGSNIIGFIASGNVGMAGVENYYNSTLNGTNGREYGYLNSDNNFEKTIKEAKNGLNLTLTLDANIQSVVEDKITAFQKAHENECRPGSGSYHMGIILMNPNTGEILGMGQYPSYDASNPFDLSGLYDQGTIAAMSDEEKLDALNSLWQNYCLTATYEPGSTGKPFTVAAGLESGALNGDEVYYCDGGEYIANYHVRCNSRVGHGSQTIAKALMNSCNDALMQMSYVIGPETFTKYQKIFGFGLKTNIDLPGEARTDSLVYSLDNMTTLDLATNSFGQNYNCTMIQMASAFSSLINGGYYYRPHVVKKITDSDGNTVQRIEPELVRETVSRETSDMIREFLHATVAEGTAKTAKVNGYSMGGKTGTAQMYPRDGINYLVSFIGFVPAVNPQVVVYVTIDRPNVESQPHSTFAQEVAKQVLEDSLPYLNIFPDEELEPEEEEEEEAAAPAPAAEAPAEGEGQEEAPAEAPAEPAPEEAVTAEGIDEGVAEAPATDIVTSPDPGMEPEPEAIPENILEEMAQ